MYSDRLEAWAAERGYRIAWGPWSVFREAWDDLARRRGTGELDEAFDRSYLTPATGPVPADGGPARWVVVVVVPRPAHSVAFTSRGKALRLLLPPTYVRFRPLAADVLRDLGLSVFCDPRAVEPLPALLKATAARLGLVSYGRNNVTYAEGLGSYFQLVGGSTAADLSRGAADPRPPSAMAACEACTACAAACPTAAIPADRFLLRAERCLVYHNESRADLPAWIPGGAHRCLMGCLFCQTACPVNAGLLRVEPSGVALSEEETRSVLAPSPSGADPFLRGADGKLAGLGLTEEPAAFWRNARAAFAARGWPRPLPE